MILPIWGFSRCKMPRCSGRMQLMRGSVQEFIRTSCKSCTRPPSEVHSHHCISFVSILMSWHQEEVLSCNGVVLYLLLFFSFSKLFIKCNFLLNLSPFFGGYFVGGIIQCIILLGQMFSRVLDIVYPWGVAGMQSRFGVSNKMFSRELLAVERWVPR